MPDYTTDTQIYQSLQTVLGEKNVPVIYPAQGDTFSLGEAEIQVVGLQNYVYDSDNDKSLCLRICYGDFQCLLTGDAEQDAEQDMVASRQDLTCDLYVVGHHGSSSSTSEELLDAATPAYAFLSVGEDNPLWAPHSADIERPCNSMELPYSEPISRGKSPSIQMGSNAGSAQSLAKTGVLEIKAFPKNPLPQRYRRPHSMC